MALSLAGPREPVEKLIFLDALWQNKIRSIRELRGFTHLNPREQLIHRWYLLAIGDYLVERFGWPKMQNIFVSFSGQLSPGSVEEALQLVCQLDETTLHHKVIAYLKDKYPRPKHQHFGDPVETFDTYYYHWAFAPIAHESAIYFLSDRHDEVLLYRKKNNRVSSVLPFSYGWTIDDLQGFSSPPDISADGKYLLLAARRGYSNRLFMIPTDRFSPVKAFTELDFEDYSGACFAPNQKSIIFVGMKKGISELYQYFWHEKKLVQLTNDQRAKYNPRMSPDGNKIVYTAEFSYQRDICVLDRTNKEILQWSYPDSEESHPQFVNNQEILFLSQTQEKVYLLTSSLSGKLWQQKTSTPYGIYTPFFHRQGQEIYFSCYENGHLQVYKKKIAELEEQKRADQPQLPKTLPDVSALPVEIYPYQADTSTDFFFPLLIFNTLRITDYSATHNFQTQFGIFSSGFFNTNNRRGQDNLGLNLGARSQATYTFSRFFNVTLFANAVLAENERKENEDVVDYSAGGSTTILAEITPRLSLEFGYTAFHSQVSEELREGFDRHFWTGGFFSQVSFQNIRRRGLDPTGGYRFQFGFSIFDEIFGSDNNYKSFEADMRYYFSLWEDWIVMTRLQADLAHEDIPFFFDLGGQNNLRGLSRDEIEGTERWVATAELRFPIYRDLNVEFFGLVKDIRAFVFVEMGAASTEVITKLKDWDDIDVEYTVGGGIRVDYFFLQKLPIPLTVQMGQRLDSSDSPVFYFGASRNF
jgi:hypothetical protein